MKMLILGGTGAMGKHLVDLLKEEKDNRIVITSRTVRQNEDNISYIQGNAHDINFLASLLEESWDVIVDFMGYKTEEFRGRTNLLLNSTRHYVFLSSSRVYAESDTPLTEASPRLLDISTDDEFLSTDEYSLSKAKQEDILQQHKKKNWTIIRPYITYSENRLQLGVLEKEEWLYRVLHGKPIVFSRDMLGKETTLTYGLDVAKGIISIIGEPTALGQCFHITNQTPTTWREVLNTYLDVLEQHLGKRPKVKLLETKPFLYSRPGKYQVVYDRLFNRLFDNSKIATYTNVAAFTEPTQGITQCLRSFLESPNFGNINWRNEAKKDKQTLSFSNLRDIHGFRTKLHYIKHRILK